MCLFAAVTNIASADWTNNQTFECHNGHGIHGKQNKESAPTVSFVWWLSIWYCTRTNDVRGSHADRNAEAITAASAVIVMSPCPDRC